MFKSPLFSRRTSLTAAVVVSLMAAFGVAGGASAASAAQPGTGSISGTVFGGEADAPEANASVQLELPGGDYVQNMQTDANGDYSFTGLPAASYIIYFQPNYGDNYASEYSGNTPILSQATSIPLATGQALTGVDEDLPDGATVTGQVDGSAVAGQFVSVNIMDSAGNYYSSGSIDQNGDYSISGLPAGSYTAEFSLQGNYTSTNQWWDNESSFASADYFTLTAGATTTDIDDTFGGGATASVSGTVDGPDSSPVGEENVLALGSDGSVLGSTSTADDGTYTISGLQPGSYTLEFQNGFNAPTLASQWWQGEPSFAAADYFTLNAGDTLTGFDANLAVGGEIDGTVTDGTASGAPLSNVYVDAYENGQPVNASAFTDGNGNYAITGLAPGSYELYFQPSYPSTDAIQWWQNAASIGGATPVVVTGTSVVTGINATLEAGGSISGTVSGKAANGSVFAASNAQVAVYNSDGSLFTNAYYADLNGNYSIPNVPAGSYTLYFTPQPDTNDFVPQWWKNQSTEATATQVVVGVGQNVKHISPVFASTTLKAVAPKITGSLKVGSTLTAKPGNWGPGTVSFSYQWSRNGAQVSGATASTYVLSNADANASITVTVTGSETGFTTDALTSAARGPVTGGILATGTPTISGTTIVGQVLTADPGTWGPGSVNLTYKWFRGSTRIVGATSSTYTLVKADGGKTITVKVTGAEPGFTTATVASAPTGIVAH